jgi:hypothetical protein
LTFYGIIIILAKAQQANVALEDVTVVNARPNRESRVHECVDIAALQILANQCQPGLVTQVVGQFFNYKIDHIRLHLLGKMNKTEILNY